MTGSDIYDLIEKIAATSGKNDKVALLAAQKETPTSTPRCDAVLKEVLVWALNPLISFGVKKLPEPRYEVLVKSDFGAHTWALLVDLRDRNRTGHDALGAIAAELDRLDEKSGLLLRRILLKDLRAGFGANTVNKVWKNLIPDPPYMRCSLTTDVAIGTWPWAEGVISQEKADGMFANLHHTAAGEIQITSRSGSEFETEELNKIRKIAALLFPMDTVTFGEFVVEQDGKDLPRAESNGVMNSLLKGGPLEANQVVTYRAWDQIPGVSFVPKGKCVIPYLKRFILLAKQIGTESKTVRAIPTKACRNIDQAMEHYREMLAAGKEGTVVKHPHGEWKDGTSKAQVKMKLEVAVELKVVGVNEGTGKFAGQIGSLRSESSDGRLKVNVSGRGDAMRGSKFEEWLDQIITVKANAVMTPSKEGEDYSLFLPILVEKRDDKTEADSLPRILDQFAAAIVG